MILLGGSTKNPAESDTLWWQYDCTHSGHLRGLEHMSLESLRELEAGVSKLAPVLLVTEHTSFQSGEPFDGSGISHGFECTKLHFSWMLIQVTWKIRPI